MATPSAVTAEVAAAAAAAPPAKEEKKDEKKTEKKVDKVRLNGTFLHHRTSSKWASNLAIGLELEK